MQISSIQCQFNTIQCSTVQFVATQSNTIQSNHRNLIYVKAIQRIPVQAKWGLSELSLANSNPFQAIFKAIPLQLNTLQIKSNKVAHQFHSIQSKTKSIQFKLHSIQSMQFNASRLRQSNA